MASLFYFCIYFFWWWCLKHQGFAIVILNYQWQSPEAWCRLREASEDDELIIDDESDQTGRTVAVSLRAGRPLNVPNLWITWAIMKTRWLEYFFLRQERLWKLGVRSSSISSPSHRRKSGLNTSELSSQKSFLVKMITNQVRMFLRHWRNLRWYKLCNSQYYLTYTFRYEVSSPYSEGGWRWRYFLQSLMIKYLALMRKKMIGLIAELAMASQKAARKRCWVYGCESMEVL